MTKKMNAEAILTATRIIATLDRIQNSPADWNQEHWHCGSTHCFLGHAEVLAGLYDPERWSESTTFANAVEWLGIDVDDGYWLLAGERTFSDLYWYVWHRSAETSVDFERRGRDKELGFVAGGRIIWADSGPEDCPRITVEDAAIRNLTSGEPWAVYMDRIQPAITALQQRRDR